jgi:hypothetical protein
MIEYAGQSFEYRNLDGITYHVLTDPAAIRELLTRWIMHEWESDHRAAPHEGWTVEWMARLPVMSFRLEVIDLAAIRPRPDLMAAPGFLPGLGERADEREEAVQRGVSIEPLLVDRDGMELMDGYTRHLLLQRRARTRTYAYIGSRKP